MIKDIGATQLKKTLRDKQRLAGKVQSFDLGWGTFETTKAPPGRFSRSFDKHAIILSKTPGVGPVTMNGVKVMTPSNMRHTFSVFRPKDRVSGVFEMETIYDTLLFKPGYVEDMLARETNCLGLQLPPTLRLTPPPLFLAIWRRIRRNLDSAKVSEACAQLLLVYLVAPQLQNIPDPSQNGRADAVTRVISYIDVNLAANIEVMELAGVAGLSMFHFSRVFKRATGLSVHRFVLERRLQLARRTLQSSNQSIAQVALDCGFGSQSHLTTSFRKRYAITPRAFRDAIGWQLSLPLKQNQ